jgi:hypothetical protein
MRDHVLQACEPLFNALRLPRNTCAHLSSVLGEESGKLGLKIREVFVGALCVTGPSHSQCARISLSLSSFPFLHVLNVMPRRPYERNEGQGARYYRALYTDSLDDYYHCIVNYDPLTMTVSVFISIYMNWNKVMYTRLGMHLAFSTHYCILFCIM